MIMGDGTSGYKCYIRNLKVREAVITKAVEEAKNPHAGYTLNAGNCVLVSTEKESQFKLDAEVLTDGIKCKEKCVKESCTAYGY